MAIEVLNEADIEGLDRVQDKVPIKVSNEVIIEVLGRVVVESSDKVLDRVTIEV